MRDEVIERFASASGAHGQRGVAAWHVFRCGHRIRRALCNEARLHALTRVASRSDAPASFRPERGRGGVSAAMPRTRCEGQLAHLMFKGESSRRDRYSGLRRPSSASSIDRKSVPA